MKSHETGQHPPVPAQISHMQSGDEVKTEREEAFKTAPDLVQKLTVLAGEPADHEVIDHGYDVEPPVEEDLIEPGRRKRFSLPSREQVLAWTPFLAVLLLGAILRFWGLGDKPLHHDESLHAYFSLQLMHNLENWAACFSATASCYHYDPLLHGPFQFHAIALVYKLSQLLGAPDQGVNTTTVRIAAALLGTVIVGLPYFLRDYLGKLGAWLACLLLAISPSMVYFSRFAREDIYMACFTLLLVVATGRYIRERKLGWLVLAAAGFMLSYATKEATFLTMAIFGSFVGALLVWELGVRRPWAWGAVGEPREGGRRWQPRSWGPLLLGLYFVVLAIVAKVFFGWMKELSAYSNDPRTGVIADGVVQQLKTVTVGLVPWVGIVLGCYVLSILLREMLGRMPLPGQSRLARWVKREEQPVLDTLLHLPWTHWFFALLTAWAIFLLLFTVLFTNIRGGIGDGIWQGLYYWLKQQQVARGDQPWYYYLLLIPLYEQVGVVFGLVGMLRCVLKPSRFRLFVLYWCVGNVCIYSWAAEKMPWLMIHMTMPLMLLAAIGLQPVVGTLLELIKGWRTKQKLVTSSALDGNALSEKLPVARAFSAPGLRARGIAVASFVLAILLLLPTLHNMYEVNYVHAADGPHEMMVYVQTTTDVNLVMAKLDALDKKLYGGKREIPIGLVDDATWPFAWYLRDYKHVCFQFPTGCPSIAQNIPVIITGGDNLANFEAKYASNTSQPRYLVHQYHMRTWWDEGYKPPPCIPDATNKCVGQPTWGGVGPLLWLSYGDTPPPGAHFDLGLAVKNVWQWWWERKAIGSTTGSYDMGLFIREDLGVTP
ncbi:TIGR03663 family protein [Ktedonosporobacter rubrisoli]|uniref:TIGR03663 family protein n=1 Tax=Ktedonosporobacter rubrisoli TaxID=2509675 RepID=A0A4P6JSP6_KTERU|nr:flippase activity-associated protein Agl23 [Ktedonosporobacter rubrisoli]QBD78434.1 TIGR03663 family protein [Ktedonosporobacter rubrisoli]